MQNCEMNEASAIPRKCTRKTCKTQVLFYPLSSSWMDMRGIVLIQTWLRIKQRPLVERIGSVILVPCSPRPTNVWQLYLQMLSNPSRELQQTCSWSSENVPCKFKCSGRRLLPNSGGNSLGSNGSFTCLDWHESIPITHLYVCWRRLRSHPLSCPIEIT